jgi:hypothetical protein
MCRKEVNLRNEDGPVMQGRHDYIAMKSPSIIEDVLYSNSVQIKALQRENYKLKQVNEMLKRDQVEASNINEDELFDTVELKKLYDNLLSKEEVEDKEIFEYIFKECMAVGERIKKQGHNRGHRYSGLVIQFACMLRAKCNVDMYDFFRKVFNLPPNQTLCQYSGADSTSPDGLMMQTIIRMAEIFHKLEIPIGDWRRYLNLLWDSHVIRGQLGESSP